MSGARAGHFGLYPAIVTDLVDPDELGRIEVGLPWLGAAGEDARAWATLLSPYADNEQGLMILPEVDTQVVVGFEAGDTRRPYIVGSAWNGHEQLPERPGPANNLRLLHTRSGSRLEFDDTQGAAKVTLKLKSGHELVLDDAAGEVHLKHAQGSSITFTPAGAIEIDANATVEISAGALNVHAPIATFDGVVHCQSVICDSAVASPTYTPGAGNIW